MGGAPYRLAVLSPRPQPYHSALYRALTAHPRIDLVVYYLFEEGTTLSAQTSDADFGRFEWGYPVLEGYRSHFLRNRAPRPSAGRFQGSFHPELLQRLHPRFHDAVVIPGWFGSSVWLAHLTCWARRLPVLFRSSANAAELAQGHHGLKGIVLPRLFRRCAAFLVLGTRNAEFYRHYGVPEEKLFLTPHSVDNDFFQRLRREWLPRRPEIRAQWGVPENAVLVLYAGRLAPEKRLGDLLVACQRLADPRLWLVLAGDGRERGRLEQQIRSLPLSQARITGFLGQEELARLYLAADIFVLPSGREPWGLVINEAMNFSLPVIASAVVGAVPDLVRDDNGLVFPPGDTDALLRCLKALVDDPVRRALMGQRSLERILGWSHQSSTKMLLRALEFSVGSTQGA